MKLDKNIRQVVDLKTEEKEKRKQYYEAFKKKNPNYYKEKRAKEKAENFERALFYQTMSLAKKRKIEFKLKIIDIVIPERCPMTEMIIVKSTGHGNLSNPYVFLIDDNLGYVRSNIIITSVLANQLRNCGKEQIFAYVKYLNSLP